MHGPQAFPERDLHHYTSCKFADGHLAGPSPGCLCPLKSLSFACTGGYGKHAPPVIQTRGAAYTPGSLPEITTVQTPRRNNRTRVRLSDVALKVGVSPITISRALRSPEKVSPDLRRKIFQAVEEMGYVPDLVARALASRHSGVVKVLAPAINNPNFADIVGGIAARMARTGLQAQYGSTGFTEDGERAHITSVAGQNPAGIIVVGPEHTQQLGGLLNDITCPVSFVLEQSQNAGRMAVAIDHEAVGATATHFLLQRGYRHIGFVGAQPNIRQRRRADGYERELRKAGCFDPSLVCIEQEPTSVGLGFRLCAALLEKDPRLDAIFCQNDDLALGVLFECQRRGVRVPDDFGILGVSDLEFSAFTQPAMSTIGIPRHELGFHAADMLVRAIDSRLVSDQRTELGFTLVKRATTR